MKKLWSKFWKSSIQKRKQRKYVLRAPLHIRHRFMASLLDKDLREKYKIRSVPVRKGDKVRVLRGDFKGKSGDVVKVSLSKLRVYVKGVENIRKDGSKVLYPIHPSNLMIVKLNLSDPRRKDKVERFLGGDN